MLLAAFNNIYIYTLQKQFAKLRFYLYKHPDKQGFNIRCNFAILLTVIDQ